MENFNNAEGDIYVSRNELEEQSVAAYSCARVRLVAEMAVRNVQDV
jgi:hypothetical protein